MEGMKKCNENCDKCGIKYSCLNVVKYSIVKCPCRLVVNFVDIVDMS